MSALETLNTTAIPEFCKKNHIQKLSVFGSMARGDFREDSDVDVLVTFLPDTKVGLIALSRMAIELSEIFGRKVDLVTERSLKHMIKDAVISEAEVLYAA